MQHIHSKEGDKLIYILVIILELITKCSHCVMVITTSSSQPRPGNWYKT